MTTPLLQGFPPIVDDGARVLILGSFASAQSLAAHQYYANPRNAFWPITSALFGFDVQAPYETRLAALQSNGVALWDVLHMCHHEFHESVADAQAELTCQSSHSGAEATGATMATGAAIEARSTASG